MNFRCLPMNLRAEDLASGILRESVKVGASLADVDPMNIDKSVSFVNGFLEIPLFFFFGHTACGILVPPSRIESVLPSIEAWRPNHHTARGFPEV